MRLICLNAWMGIRLESLSQFIEENLADTDIFRLQEVMRSQNSKVLKELFPGAKTDLFQKLSLILDGFNGYYTPMQKSDDFYYGLAIFVKKSIKVEETGDFFTYSEMNKFDGRSETMPSKLQWLNFRENEKKYTICNFHGISIWPKTDTEDRLNQSKIIKEFLDKTESSKILCGDFNLGPETKSLAITGEGMRDLVKEFKIENTRSSLHKHNDEEGKISDYIFVSPDIKIENFKVPQEITASDHLPLILEF